MNQGEILSKILIEKRISGSELGRISGHRKGQISIDLRSTKINEIRLNDYLKALDIDMQYFNSFNSKKNTIKSMEGDSEIIENLKYIIEQQKAIIETLKGRISDEIQKAEKVTN